MDSNSFKDKMGDWFSFWEPFILSNKMDKIYETLKSDAQSKDFKTGKKTVIFPTSKDTFNAFKYCNPKNLKLVIYGQDAYPGEYYDTKLPHADGLALSNSNSTGKMQPSLRAFLDGIAKEYNCNYEPKDNLDLKYLAEQGVLLLNRSLTVKKDMIGSHSGLWDEFHQYFLDKLQSEHPNVPVLFLGKDAAVLKKYVFEMANPIFILDHPSYAARSEEDWETKGYFQKINNLLRVNFNTAIKWFSHTWDDLQEDLNSEDPERVRLAKLTDETLLPF